MSRGYTFEAIDNSQWPNEQILEWYPDLETLDKAVMWARLKGFRGIRYWPCTRKQHDTSIRKHLADRRQKQIDQDYDQRWIDSTGEY